MPTRRKRLQKSSRSLVYQPTGAGGGKGAARGRHPLDDLFPRVEIDGLLKGTTILADAKSDAWKTKKEALETLQAILDQGANKRLKPSMGEKPIAPRQLRPSLPTSLGQDLLVRYDPEQIQYWQLVQCRQPRTWELKQPRACVALRGCSRKRHKRDGEELLLPSVRLRRHVFDVRTCLEVVC